MLLKHARLPISPRELKHIIKHTSALASLDPEAQETSAENSGFPLCFFFPGKRTGNSHPVDGATPLEIHHATH